MVIVFATLHYPKTKGFDEQIQLGFNALQIIFDILVFAHRFSSAATALQ
jgi:hypothetical protein